MTIGPAPMIRIDWMSLRRGMQEPREENEASYFRSLGPTVDQIDEALEEIMTVLRAGRSLRMVLHREDRLALNLQPFVGIVEERDVRRSHAKRQGGRIDHEAVILAGDFHLAGFQVLDWMIGAAMAMMHLHGASAERQCQHLMAE